MKIIFFGSSSYVIPILETLKNNFELSLVITTEEKKGAVITYCQKNKIELISAKSLKEPKIKDLISKAKTTLAVLADFGLIIPEDILSAFPKGIINLHPSLLPKYRGPTPVQTAIKNGDQETGITIIKLDKEVDHGEILEQETEKITNTDTAETLYKRLFEKGAKILPKVLDKFLKDELKLTTQNHNNATFTQPLTRRDGEINLHLNEESKNLKEKIRAYFPWPGVWFKTKLNKTEKIIKLLPGDKLQVEGKKPMTYKDFLNGYSEAREILKLFTTN